MGTYPMLTQNLRNVPCLDPGDWIGVRSRTRIQAPDSTGNWDGRQEGGTSFRLIHALPVPLMIVLWGSSLETDRDFRWDSTNGTLGLDEIDQIPTRSTRSSPSLYQRAINANPWILNITPDRKRTDCLPWFPSRVVRRGGKVTNSRTSMMKVISKLDFRPLSIARSPHVDPECNLKP